MPKRNPGDDPDMLGGKTCCGYQELTAHEFEEHKNMLVLVLRAPQAAGKFKGFREVVALSETAEVDALLKNRQFPQIIGLVCKDGEFSSRQAIRLSRQGHRVFHLVGGLREWTQTCPWLKIKVG
ncbi:MAG: rhodanese-like domain-containing protein [Deltaproteobacteria bacterium]|nr:rhodanese-like domain-containing protein [Deltaproteobacteria bacterium]